MSRGSAPAGAKVLGQVHSAPVDVLVEQMMRASDNVIAEVLARQVAIATQRPASFAGAAEAVRATLAAAGIEIGSGMVDGSGLSVLDRMPVAALSATLLAAVDAEQRPAAPAAERAVDRRLGRHPAGRGPVQRAGGDRRPARCGPRPAP